MPALLLHLTLARRAADQAPRSALAEAARTETPALLLGSILPDLPYHARFFRQLARHLLRWPYRPSDWGDLLHTRQTGRLALALVSHVRRARASDVERCKALAFVAGYLCHHAVDSTVHPAIDVEVDRRRQSAPDARRPAEVVHAEVERLQSLLHHHARLGHDICGTPYPRQLVRRMAGAGLLRPRFEPCLERALRAALLETHGRVPPREQLRDWLWGVTVYGELMSTPLGRATEGLGADVESLRRRHYLGPDIDLERPLAAAVNATFDAWQAGSDLLSAERISAEVRAVFLQRVPDVDLGNGA